VAQGIQSEIFTIPKPIYEVTCEKIMVGHQFLDQYYTSEVDKSWEPKIWWRDATAVHYQLSRNGSVPIDFWDGFDNGTGTYPDFKGMALGIGALEFGFLVDMYGNKYLSVSGSPPPLLSASAGISYIEGYLCDWSLSSGGNCYPGIPSASEIEKAVSGLCLSTQLVILAGFDIGALCKDVSITNWSLSSSVSTFYVGLEVGGGSSLTATIPLSWFGAAPDPRQGWKWVIDTRRQYGWTWNKIRAEWWR
jgi:hypothetical protein